MITLAWPWMLLGLPMPFLVRRFLSPAAPAGAALRWPLAQHALPADETSALPARRRLAVPLLIWMLLVLSAARPEWIETPTGTPVSGRSMLLALDVSASMRSANLGQEMAMAVVRRTARAFVKGREGDRIGLVLFGTEPYVQAPLTFDLEAVAQMADEAIIGIAGEGTAIGDALALSVGRLRTLPDDPRVLVILTDGASTSGIMSVPDAIALARLHRVRVYTVGVGTADTRVGEGLDAEVLRTIAEATGGRYFHATDGAGLERTYASLDELEPLAKSEAHLKVARALYHWPLGLATLLASLLMTVYVWRRYAYG